MDHIITAIGLTAIAMSPANARKMGKGGIGIDEKTQVPRCDRLAR